MFIDIDWKKKKKYNQNAYGDYFISKRYPDETKLIAVLSDGLGSGIKANILSCMTATMLLRFIEGDQIPISKAAEIIMNSLPVCKVRRISYSTFSAIEVDDEGIYYPVEDIEIYQAKGANDLIRFGDDSFAWNNIPEENKNSQNKVNNDKTTNGTNETKKDQTVAKDKIPQDFHWLMVMG